LVSVVVSLRISPLRIFRFVSPRRLTEWSLGLVGDHNGRVQFVDIPVTFDAQVSYELIKMWDKCKNSNYFNVLSVEDPGI